MEKKYMKSTLKKESHKPKELTRTFSLQISKNLLNCRKWTQEVIDEIENDNLLVISTNKPLSLTVFGGTSKPRTMPFFQATLNEV